MSKISPSLIGKSSGLYNPPTTRSYNEAYLDGDQDQVVLFKEDPNRPGEPTVMRYVERTLHGKSAIRNLKALGVDLGIILTSPLGLVTSALSLDTDHLAMMLMAPLYVVKDTVDVVYHSVMHGVYHLTNSSE